MDFSRSARHAVGAVVFASTALHRQSRPVKGGGSYASSFAPEAHFGIPAGQQPAVDVRWPPDGTPQHLGLVQPGKRYRVIESGPAQQVRIVVLPESENHQPFGADHSRITEGLAIK